MRDVTTLAGTDRRARLVRTALINGAVLLLLLALYATLAGFALPLLGVRQARVAQALAAVCAAACAVPAHRLLARLADAVWSSLRGYEALLREASAAISDAADPAQLNELLAQDLPRRLRLRGATLWMLEPPEDRVFVAIGEDPAAPGATLLANGASATQVGYAHTALRVPELPEVEWAQLFAARGVRLAVPLRARGRLVGIYGVGAPVGGGSHPARTVSLLLTLAPAAAGAIESFRASAEIARLNAQLRALDQLKDEFIESVGHELRTPLTSLTLALHLLAFKPELTRDMAHVLQVSADRLQALVERVLRLGQQVRGESRTALALASIELLPLLEDIAAEYAPVAHAKGLQLLIGVPEGLAVWGERSRLRRALHEVLDNAVRYSSRGAIQVTAEVQDGLALISITDQGPGIPDEEREHLFDSFYRGRSARALAETPGAGLGLNLAKRDIELLGGQIWLERSGSDGSMMCVSLPAVQLSYNELGAPD